MHCLLWDQMFPISTVLVSSFGNAQGCQALTLLPVEQVGQLVAFQAGLAFVFDV